jgi:hypothetical protein
MESSVRSHWETVDAELRQFLSRLGGVTDAPSGGESGAVWRLWIAAGTVLFLARRASSGPWRPCRHAASGAAQGAVRRPVPIGPWPLGPP